MQDGNTVKTKMLTINDDEIKLLLEAVASAGKFWRGVARRDQVKWERDIEDKVKLMCQRKSDMFDALCLKLERMR